MGILYSRYFIKKDLDNNNPSADHWANAVMFNYDGVSYTLAPQLVSILKF